MSYLRHILFPTASGESAIECIVRVKFEFKLQYLWVGAFWKRIGNCVDLWICFVPCVPLHIYWHWHDPEQ